MRMQMAFADPPYPGQAKRHYGKDAAYQGEVNHSALVGRLLDNYRDGWALSTNVPSLELVIGIMQSYGLSQAHGDYRIGAWVKPFASFKPGVNPAYAWEPVIFFGGRKRTREQPTIPDFCIANITLERGVHGAKPKKFCYWVFSMLNLEPDDELADLYPGSGAVTRYWEQWRLEKRAQMEAAL